MAPLRWVGLGCDVHAERMTPGPGRRTGPEALPVAREVVATGGVRLTPRGPGEDVAPTGGAIPPEGLPATTPAGPGATPCRATVPQRLGENVPSSTPHQSCSQGVHPPHSCSPGIHRVLVGIDRRDSRRTPSLPVHVPGRTHSWGGRRPRKSEDSLLKRVRGSGLYSRRRETRDLVEYYRVRVLTHKLPESGGRRYRGVLTDRVDADRVLRRVHSSPWAQSYVPHPGSTPVSGPGPYALERVEEGTHSRGSVDNRTRDPPDQSLDPWARRRRSPTVFRRP